MDQNTLLTLMIIAYISPIGVVYYKYSTAVSGAGTRSISSIITSQEPLFAHENDTRGGGGAMSTIIPNETLHRSVYVRHGRIHDIIRIPTMYRAQHMVVPLRHRHSPHRDIWCDIHPRT